MTAIVAETTLDLGKIEAFAGQLMSIYSGSLLSYLIDIGHRVGLFTAAAQGPATSEELAARAGLTERYVREWLGALATGGLVEFEPATERYSLPAELAACLTPGPMNMAPLAVMNTHLGKHVHQVARAFREGGGVPYAEYRPEFTDLMDAISRSVFDSLLIDAYLPMVNGLSDLLIQGAEVADVACGTGHALVVLGRNFPASTFVGFDLDDGAIARARAEAAGAGLTNVQFHVVDAARLEDDGRFDVVFVFDAIHDQVEPAEVLQRICTALKPGGLFVMKEPHAGDTVQDNLGNPFAPVLYATSTLHCLTVSLAHGGAGIGTAFGEGMARRLLAEAGFGAVHVQPAPGDPVDAVYVTSKPGITQPGGAR